MIIQCEKCKTKFRLDDSRITDRGVKVRCTKCKHVFRVQKEIPETTSSSGFSSAVATGELFSAPPVDQNFVADAALDGTFDSEAFESASVQSILADISAADAVPFDDSTISFESSDDLLASGRQKVEQPIEEPSFKSGDVDFSGFDFGDSAAEADSTMPSSLSAEDFTGATTEPESKTPHKEASQGLDFSDDDIFGAVVPSVPEATSGAISFDFEADSFAESMQMGDKETPGKGGSLFALDTLGDAPFNLGEIDFGDELTSVAVQQVNPEDLKPAQEVLFAPLAKAQNKSADEELTRSFLGTEPAAAQQELPPLSIASRRKQSPMYNALIIFIAASLISVLAYYGYTTFYSPKETVTADAGKISVRAVKAVFIRNSTAGNLLVVSGEALNEYPEPRAALQVKVTLFDAAGQSIAAKTAYGGNPLTPAQMQSLSLDKIEAAMANQFGDSLANMEVAPGKAIPFVVVLANFPDGAKDYTVEAAGSTVATGKQQ